MKYLKIPLILLITAIFFTLSSCINCVEPEGKIKSLEKKLDDFIKIDVDIPANIKIITGDSSSIKISAPESILAQIQPVVKRNRLMIYGNICKVTNNQVNIVVTMPKLKDINISGSANIFSEIPIRTEEINIVIKGSGTVSLNTFTNTNYINIKGDGNVLLSGTCQSLRVDITGSGEFKGLGLNSYKAVVKIKGSGTASVVALNNLDAKMNGSGEINYSGDPKLRIDISGSGKLTKLN